MTSSEFLWLTALNLKPSDCGKIIFSPKRPDRSRNTLEKWKISCFSRKNPWHQSAVS